MCATELSAKAAKSTCRTNILCKGELTLFAHKCKFIYFLKRIQRIEKIYTHTHTHTYTPLVVQMVKKSVMQEDLGLIHGTGRSPGEGNGYPLQYSCPENYMDRETQWATVYGVTKSWMTEQLTLSLYNTHTHTYTYSGILLSHKKNEIWPFRATWIYLEGIVLSEIDTERQILYDITYMWHLRNKTSQ